MANVDTVDLTKLILVEQSSTPSSPASGKQKLYVRTSDHLLCILNSSGAITPMGAPSLTDPTANRGEIIRRGASALEALQAKTTGKVLIGDGTDVVSAYPPGYEFDYAQITASVTLTGANEGAAVTVVDGNAVTYDGSTIILVEFFAPTMYSSSVATADSALILVDGSTVLGRIADHRSTSASRNTTVVRASRRLTPSAGAHTYHVKGYDSGTNAIVVAGAGGTGNDVPAFLRITKAA